MPEATSETVRGLYQHYKGSYYAVFGSARHSEDNCAIVLYQSLYGDFGYWVRPQVMFSENVDAKGEIVARFTRVADLPPEWHCYDARMPSEITEWLQSGGWC